MLKGPSFQLPSFAGTIQQVTKYIHWSMAKPEEELHLPYNPASEDSYMRILHWQGALQLIIASKACVYYNVFITMNHAHCHTFMRLYLYMYMYLNLDSISCSVLHNYM